MRGACAVHGGCSKVQEFWLVRRCAYISRVGPRGGLATGLVTGLATGLTTGLTTGHCAGSRCTGNEAIARLINSMSTICFAVIAGPAAERLLTR